MENLWNPISTVNRRWEVTFFEHIFENELSARPSMAYLLDAFCANQEDIFSNDSGQNPRKTLISNSYWHNISLIELFEKHFLLLKICGPGPWVTNLLAVDRVLLNSRFLCPFNLNLQNSNEPPCRQKVTSDFLLQ